MVFLEEGAVSYERGTHVHPELQPLTPEKLNLEP